MALESTGWHREPAGTARSASPSSKGWPMPVLCARQQTSGERWTACDLPRSDTWREPDAASAKVYRVDDG